MRACIRTWLSNIVAVTACDNVRFWNIDGKFEGQYPFDTNSCTADFFFYIQCICLTQFHFNFSNEWMIFACAQVIGSANKHESQGLEKFLSVLEERSQNPTVPMLSGRISLGLN